MPRIARQKTKESIFHIMCRSISEVDLFKSELDKVKYMELIKKYQKIHKFNVYNYCLMNNHLHLIIDANGTDISQIMHGINFTYAQYFNKTHKRHGHLFQDRFKSKIINSDRYLITASAYIHNNATDIEGYGKCPEKYEYSSLSVYMGLRHDPYELIKPDLILGLFGDDLKEARHNYYKFVLKCDASIMEDMEFENEGTLYKSHRTIFERNIEAKQIIEYIANITNTPKAMFHEKYNRKLTEAKAILVLLMKNLCNFNATKICSVLGNITQGNVSRLTGIGFNLVKTNDKYNLIFEDLIKIAEAR